MVTRADGDIILGDADTDTITFNGEIASDIIPDATDTYSLGSASKRWDEVYVPNFNASNVNTNPTKVAGINDLTNTPGNTIFVAENGVNTNNGIHLLIPFKTVKHVHQATAGDMIYNNPGEYEEVFPNSVNVGVTVRGAGLRPVTIKPQDDTRYNNAFLPPNGESTVEELTVKDFYSGGNYLLLQQCPNNSTYRQKCRHSTFCPFTYVSGGIFEVGDSTQANITAATYNQSTGDLTITIDGVHDSFLGARHFPKDLTFSCNGGNPNISQ